MKNAGQLLTVIDNFFTVDKENKFNIKEFYLNKNDKIDGYEVDEYVNNLNNFFDEEEKWRVPSADEAIWIFHNYENKFNDTKYKWSKNFRAVMNNYDCMPVWTSETDGEMRMVVDAYKAAEMGSKATKSEEYPNHGLRIICVR